MRAPCLKRTVRCVVLRDDGRRHEGMNLCEVRADACPRAGLATGEQPELCDSWHAEQQAAAAAAGSQESKGTAFLYGHDHLCRACQLALVAVNVRRFVIVAEGDEPWR